MTSELEEKLWKHSVAAPAEWEDVARYLVERLAQYLQQPLAIEQISPVDESSFACWFHNELAPGAGPLALRWRGVLGMEPIEGRASVSATLQLFVLRRRLTAAPAGDSTVELTFEPVPGSPGRWRCEGWRRDEYGEWDDVEPL